MTLVWLQWSLHHRTLVQEIGETDDVEGVQDINLEEESVANMVPIERNTFHQGNVCHESSPPIVGVTTVADGQSMIDREMKSVDRRAHWGFICELNN